MGAGLLLLASVMNKALGWLLAVVAAWAVTSFVILGRPNAAIARASKASGTARMKYLPVNFAIG